MNIDLFYFFTFVFGTIFGSFLNVVADRTISGERIFFGRSHCDYCNTPLKAKNLVPIFSFLWQKARCSFCGEKLSWTYPLSELLTGSAFVLAAWYSKVFLNPVTPNLLTFAYVSMVFSFYVILVMTDIKHHLLPDKIMIPAILLTFIFIIAINAYDLASYYNRLQSDTLGKYLIQAGIFNNQLILSLKRLLFLIGSSFGIALFFFSLIIITKGRGMGGGDVKLGLLIGLFNGFPYNIIAVFLGFLFGAIYSLVLIVLRRKTIKDVIAFGPFLMLASVIAFFWGEQLLYWYFGSF